MVYMRGQREDYDGWAAYLQSGGSWSFDDMLGYFRLLERNARLRDEYHSVDGALQVSDPGHVCDTSKDFLLAAQHAGHRLNTDFNGASQRGVGVMQHTYGLRSGRLQRSDVKSAFLDPLANDDRLTILTDTQVDQVLIENETAIGVVCRRRGQTTRLYAGREVLVACGTYNSSKLLMLSGIGPADELRRHGKRVERDLPGVGRGLQDHHQVPLVATTRSRSGYFGQDHGWSMVRNGLQYLSVRLGTSFDNRDRGMPFLRPRRLRKTVYTTLLCPDRPCRSRHGGHASDPMG